LESSESRELGRKTDASLQKNYHACDVNVFARKKRAKTNSDVKKTDQDILGQ
jgi:hypothetical protein